MIRITETITIDEGELQEDFVRSSGPGGQHVNKVSTAVQLRFDVARSPSLPEPVRERLMRLAGSRLSSDGVLMISARRYRSRERNRTDAVERLTALVRKAAQAPRPRRATKKTRGSQERRLKAKRRRADTKRLRRSDPRDD